MSSLRLRLTTVPNVVPRFVDDDEEGERLIGWVRNAVSKGQAPPAAVVLRPERTEVLPLGPVAQARVPVARFLASLARSTTDDAGMATAIGVIGVFRARTAGAAKDTPPVPMAAVFVEWPDNRWWYWRAVVDPETKTVIDGSAVYATATDGDALPSAFGRWWALSRRANLRLHLSRAVPDTEEASPIIH